MKSRTRRLLRQSALAAAIAAISAPASAAFFALAENSASGIGNAFAGGAAIAEDASTVWFNPAGMTRFTRPQVVVAGHFIQPSFTATVNSASAAALLGGSPISGGAGSDPGEAAVVPNIYYTHPITNSFSLGAGINAPFGLATEYDSTWAGRYHAVRSEIKTVNVNLAGAYKLNNAVSAGVGVNYQKLDAELTQKIDFATLCNAAGAAAVCGSAAPPANGGPYNPNTNPNDGDAKVKADSTAWGYNLGLLFQPDTDTRWGLAYRSKMKHTLSGNSDITLPVTGNALVDGTVGGIAVNPNFRLVDQGAKSDVTLPASWSVSSYGKVSDQLALMIDVTRTYWSALPELRIKFDSGPDSVVTLNLKDTFRLSLGTNYQVNSSWVLRAGLALDQSPVTTTADRTPRLPDADSTWYALGAGFQPNQALSFDFGYVYIKVNDSNVTKTAGAPGTENFARGNLNVNYTGSVQVLSAQARWAF
jgi:long-chain fatty acid transport protein